MLKTCPQDIKILLPCEPFKVIKSEVIGKDCHIYFECIGKHEKCPECGQPLKIHQWRNIILLGPPMGLHKKSFWHVKYCVYECPDCRLFKTQDIPFRFSNTGSTTYLVKRICVDLDIQNETVKNVARRYDLKWDRVKNIHKAFLQVLKESIPLPQPPRIAAVDEFSIEKHHKYATFVINAENKYPLYLHRGNSAEDFKPFFKMYSKSFYSKIKAFAMDQNASYSSVVKEHIPKCTIVCDFFHIIKNYNDDVIDKIRARMIRNAYLCGDKELANHLKGSKRLLMKRIKKDDWEASLALKNIMEENKDLDTAIHMREQLQRLYDYCRDEKLMERKWEQWCNMAKASCIPELMKFAENKKKRSKEIINHAKYAISSGVIEGCIAKIKVLKRVAFGFRDWDYFFLRIWYAFLPSEIKSKYTNLIWETLGLQETNQGDTVV